MFRVYAKLVLATIFWGATWTVGRTLVQEVPPFAAAFIRFAIAVTCMGFWLHHTEGRLPKARARDFAVFLVLGFFGVFLYNTFFLHGLQHIDAARGAMMVALNPVMIILASVALGYDRLSPLKLWGMGLALGGSIWVISRGDPLLAWRGASTGGGGGVGVGVGEGLIVACSVAWTIYTLMGRLASKRISALAVNTWACGLGCLFLGGAALGEAQGAWAWPNYSLKAWASLFFLGFFGTALSYIWYTEGVKKLGPARAAVFINLVPLSGVLIATISLQESLPLAVWLGGAVSLIGVALTSLANVSKIQRRVRAHRPPSLRTDIRRFKNTRGLHILEVMAACMRHGKRLNMQLRCGQHVIPLTVFPLERLVYSPLPMDALLSNSASEMRVIHVEISTLQSPSLSDNSSPQNQFYPLLPLLWNLAMRGGRDTVLPEIAGQVAYRVAPSVNLTPLVIKKKVLLNTVNRLRREATSLRSLAQWPGMDHQLASRLLNAIYLQSGLIVTRSHPRTLNEILIDLLQKLTVRSIQREKGLTRASQADRSKPKTRPRPRRHVRATQHRGRNPA